MEQDHVEFSCPSCSRPVSASRELIGRKVRCLHCQHEFPLTANLLGESTGGRAMAGGNGASERELYFRFHFQCKRCGSMLEGRPSESGQAGKCPTCGSVFTIPAVDPRTGLALPGNEKEDDEDPIPMHAYAASGDKAPAIVWTDSGEWQIRCPRCEAESPVETNNCGKCGLPFTLEGATFQPQVASNGYAVASLVLGLTSLPTVPCMGFGALPGVLALVFGMIAWQQMGSSQAAGRGRSMAVAGAVLGAAGAVLGILFFVNRF